MRTGAGARADYRVVEIAWRGGAAVEIEVILLGPTPSIADAVAAREDGIRRAGRRLGRLLRLYPTAEALALAPEAVRRELATKRARLDAAGREIELLGRIAGGLPTSDGRVGEGPAAPTPSDYGPHRTIAGVAAAARAECDALVREIAEAQRPPSIVPRPPGPIDAELARSRADRLGELEGRLPPECPTLVAADLSGSSVARVRRRRFLEAYGRGFPERVRSGELSIEAAYRLARMVRRLALGRESPRRYPGPIRTPPAGRPRPLSGLRPSGQAAEEKTADRPRDLVRRDQAGGPSRGGRSATAPAHPPVAPTGRRYSAGVPFTPPPSPGGRRPIHDNPCARAIRSLACEGGPRATPPGC